jgi:hypothetical protein
MMLYLRCLALLCVLWIGPVSFGQVITIRVIDAKNGHPLPKRDISVALLYEKGEERPSQYNGFLQLETDAHGEVRLNLPEPAPGHLSVVGRLRSESWYCGCRARVATQEVIQNGVVEGQDLAKGMPVRAEPGQISLVARRRPFFERLMYRLLAPLMS